MGATPARQIIDGAALEAKKSSLKRLIHGLHGGMPVEQAKEDFKAVLRTVGATDIAEIEEELIKDGMPREEIQRLCDVHLAVFQESLQREEKAAAGHPIDILRAEHTALLEMTKELAASARALASAPVGGERLGQIAEQLRESESHYLREENVLFPYLEKHGITQPPAIMWMEHDQIRPLKKQVRVLVDLYMATPSEHMAQQLAEKAAALAGLLESHFYKENNILFPAALRVIGEDEWPAILRQFDEIGYPSFSAGLRPAVKAPAGEPVAVEKAVAAEKDVPADGMVQFETGALSAAQLEAIFSTLPVDVTFVDAEDRVRFFSNAPERIFVRTEAAIGRAVQQCHPQKSLHVVNQILADFRGGERDSAEFWIPFNGRLVHIRYFAVRDRGGKYLGCLEVTQDITDIQKITGQKRLLD